MGLRTRVSQTVWAGRPAILCKCDTFATDCTCLCFDVKCQLVTGTQHLCLVTCNLTAHCTTSTARSYRELPAPPSLTDIQLRELSWRRGTLRGRYERTLMDGVGTGCPLAGAEYSRQRGVPRRNPALRPVYHGGGRCGGGLLRDAGRCRRDGVVWRRR